MTHYEHGTLLVTITEGRPGKIDFLTTGDDETVNPESASLRRQMDALDVLSADGWELLGPPGRHAVAGRSDEGVPAPTPEGLSLPVARRFNDCLVPVVDCRQLLRGVTADYP